jgi:hypothetical protein
MKRAIITQLPMPLHQICRTCGQPILVAPPRDWVGDAILRVLRSANGRLVKMNLIIGFSGVNAGRTTFHDRLSIYESDGWVERDPAHPKLGYRITEKGKQMHDHESAAA